MKTPFFLLPVSLCLFFSAPAQRVGVNTSAPTHNWHLIHSNGAGTISTSQGLKLQNMGANNSSWTLYTVNNGGELWIYAGANNVGRFALTGAYSAVSDVRAKNNIQGVDDVLTSVMELDPKKYRHIHQNATDPLSLGFIAQSVLPIFPELVNQSKGDDNEISYAINYAGFSVVAIKAIQEQQALIEAQTKMLDEMSAEIAELKKHLGL